MIERVRQFARWLQEQPWNAPGSDKTWVLRAQHSYRRMMKSVQRVDRD